MSPIIPSQIQKQILSWLGKNGIGAAGILLVWGFTAWRSENRLDYHYQLEKAEIREAAYLETINTQAKEMKALEKGFYFLSSSRRQSPLPEWAKVNSGHYQWKNNAFDTWLLIRNGIDPDSVLFRTDYEIWPDKELAKIYRLNDLKVIREKRVIHSVEYAPDGDEVIAWHTWKYPVLDGRGEVMGVGGVAVREDQVREKID